MNETQFEPVRDFLHRAVEQGAFPGVCAAIGRGDALLFEHTEGRASLFGGASVDDHTRYDMASLTKIMATTMVALLAVGRGDLALDTPIREFFTVPDDKKRIAVRHLLTHTSGLPAHFLLEDVCEGPEQAAETILARPLVVPVGSETLYSCMGYILLGDILQKALRQPLDALSRTMVFEPLAMAETGYLPRGGNIAATEVLGGKPLVGVVHDENARFLGGVSGNAGLFSTIGDCARFAAMLARGGAGLLPKNLFDQMIADQTPACAQRRGLGVLLQHGGDGFMGTRFPAGSFGHTGFTGTSLVVDPATGIYGVLLTNAVHPKRGVTDMLPVRRAFYDLAYACVQA